MSTEGTTHFLKVLDMRQVCKLEPQSEEAAGVCIDWKEKGRVPELV